MQIRIKVEEEDVEAGNFHVQALFALVASLMNRRSCHLTCKVKTKTSTFFHATSAKSVIGDGHNNFTSK